MQILKAKRIFDEKYNEIVDKIENKIPEPQEKFTLTLAEIMEKFRVVKPYLTFLKGGDVSGKTIDFERLKKLRKIHKENEKKDIKKLKKKAIVNKKFQIFLSIFNKKYKAMFGEEFRFRSKRCYQYFNPAKMSHEGRFVESDVTRLKKIFNIMRKQTKKISVMKEALEQMIDKWSEWDLAEPGNIVGFLEKMSETNDMKMLMFRLINKGKRIRKNKTDKLVLLEDVREKNIKNQRKLFAS